MKIIQSLLFSVLFVLCYFSLIAQNPIDSLESVLKKSNGLGEVEVLNKLADAYRSVSKEKSYELVNEALEKAKKLNSSKEQANSYNILGKLSVANDNVKEALNYFQMSYKLSLKVKFVEGISKSLNNICYVYNKTKDNANVEKYHNEAIKIFTELNETAELGNFHFSFGEYYRSNSLIEKAKQSFSKALDYFKLAKNEERVSSSMDNIATISIETSDYKGAIDLLNNSLQIRKTLGDKKKIIQTQNFLGRAFTLKGEYEKALGYYQSNLKISQDAEYPQGIANSYNSIAPIYMKLNQIDKAIEYFELALEIYEKTDQSGKLLAAGLNNLGNVYKELKNHKKAIECYQKAIAIMQKTGVMNSDVATMYLNLGDEFEKIGNNNKALEFYKRALSFQEEVGNKEGVAKSLYHMGAISLAMKNAAAALDFFARSHAISQEINSRALILSNLQEISEAYKVLGNLEKAIAAKEEYIQTKEIIYNEELNGKLTEMQTKFDADNKQHQIELMKKESEVQDAKLARQRLIIIASIIGLLLFLITIFFVWNRYRLKKKSHEALEVRNQQILQQKEEIEAQKDEIEHQKHLIEEKNQEVMDSIRYAKRIQAAVLPSDEYISEFKHDHFVLFRPKDIVSGDFYWMTKRGPWTIYVAADCTGHGVPGAFMSMLGISLLNEIVGKDHIVHSGAALDELRTNIIKSLQQKGIAGEQKDGMDIVFAAINEETMTLEFAGANNPLYHVRNGELVEYKADKQPIAIYIDMVPFTNTVIQLEKGDCIYMSSDGYEDQFGGPKGKKFMSKQFKQLIVANYDKTMAEQKAIYEKAILDWMSYTDPVTGSPCEQIDDMLVVGIRI